MSELTQEQIDAYVWANDVAQRAAEEQLANQGHDAAVAQALIANTLLVEQQRQEQQAQWAATQANETEERIRQAIPGWSNVADAEKLEILGRVQRNNAGKPFTPIGMVDEISAAITELQRENEQAAEREKRQADRQFADELLRDHTARTYSNRRSASWVSETLDPNARGAG
jgi:hypothetical protein